VQLLQALNTGHDGSMATVHANSAADALARLSSLVLHEVGNWPLVAVQHHVARAVDAVVHVARGADGVRTVVEVVEVLRDLRGDTIATRQLANASSITGVLQRGRR
jgi:pilus assembly protein CpaF